MARITFIGPVPPIRSGIAQHGGHLTETLARDHDVTVLSWQHQYPRLLFRRSQVDPTVERHPNARFTLRWWDPVSWWRAGRTGQESDLVVLVWTTPFHTLTYLVVLALTRRTRRVAIVHNALPHEPLPFQRTLTRVVLGQCDGLIAHATTVADELDELLGGKVDTVTVAHPSNIGVERKPLPPLDDGLRLLFLGFIRPYKGLDVALDALAELGQRGVRPKLTVVGEPWDPAEPWAERVAERGLSEQVDLRLGYASDDEVERLLATHHAVLLPYRSATQSGIVPIALAAGRPVVATAVGGIAEVVEDGVNGTLATPGDADSLADAIERCAAQLTDLAAAATTVAESWDDVAAAVVKAARIDPS